MKIEIFSRRTLFSVKRWYFRVRANNGQIVAQSEGYSRRVDAVSTAWSLKNSISIAEVYDA